MDPTQFREFYQENLYYIIAIQLVVGLVFGLIPLIIGIKKGKKNLGFIALLVTLVVTMLSPLLGLLSCAVFTFIVARKGAAPSAE